MTLHYRAVFDVDVHVHPITRAAIEERRRAWRRRASLPGIVDEPFLLLSEEEIEPSSLPSEEELEPQRALLAELCRDESFLRDWMASCVTLSLQEGDVIPDDLELEDPHDLLADVADNLSASSRRALDEALSSRELYVAFLDELWFSIRPAADRIELGLAAVLPGNADRIAGARYRAVVPFSVEVDEPRDVTVERIARRRADAPILDLAELVGPGEDAEAWPPPLPRERDLDPTRELLSALRGAPHTLDRIIRGDMVAAIRDGALHDVGPPPMPMEALRPLIDRLSPAHRAYLLRRPVDNWTDRVWEVEHSFECEALATTIFEVRA